jgi:hypothetical protein
MDKTAVHKGRLGDPILEKADKAHWLKKTGEERLQALEILRQQYLLMFPEQRSPVGTPPRLRRVFRVIRDGVVVATSPEE